MRLEAALLSVFLSGQLCLALGSEVEVEAPRALHRRNGDIEEHMRREAEAVMHEFGKRGAQGVFNAPGGVWPTVTVPAGFTLAGGVMLTTASVATATATIPATAAAASANSSQTLAPQSLAAKSVNSTAWAAEADQACMNAVMNLKGESSNPSGLAACYNIAYLDQQKGVFEAEVRVYNVCAPSSDFMGVTSAGMMVAMAFDDAVIQQTDGQSSAKRSLAERQMLSTPSATALPPSGALPNGIMMPVEVGIHQYLGQVNSDIMAQGVNMTEFRSILVPQISISGTNPISQKLVNTTLSSTEASFNAGVFAKAVGNATDPKSILGQPQEQIAAAAAGQPTPYDVPGLALGVFPVGLIVTSVWMALFIGVVGAGTFGRMQFRHQYRMAIKMQGEERQRRI